MTRDDSVVVSRMFECFAAGDVRGMIECVDPALEWHAAADGRYYHGHDGVREFLRRTSEGGQRLEVPLQRTRLIRPGLVLAVGRLRRSRPGQGLADSPGIWLFHLTDGKIVRIESFPSEREALEAADSPEPLLAE